MNDLTINKASIDELEKLMAWRQEVLKNVFEKDEIPSSLVEENRRYYQKHLRSGTHEAFWLDLNGQTIGCAALCLYDEMPSPDNPSGKCAYVMNVYVRKPYRGHHGASFLVEHLIEEARKKGITKIYLETTDLGRPVYERLGFTDMHDYMHWEGKNGEN